jgi:hypothetical protein
MVCFKGGEQKLYESTRDPNKPKIRLEGYNKPVHVDVTEFLKENNMQLGMIRDVEANKDDKTK